MFGEIQFVGILVTGGLSRKLCILASGPRRSLVMEW